MGSLFINTGLSPLYVIEMIIKFCVSLEFYVSLDESVSSTVITCQLVFLRCQHVVQS